MFAMSLLLPQILQLPKATGYGLGQSIMASGLVLAPSGLVMMATAPLSARISKTKGPKVTLMLGAVVVAVGYGLNIALMSEVWHLVLASCIIGAGIGLAYGAMPALVMAAVPVSETAAANSLNTLMRSIGTSVSSAVAGVILAQMTTSFGSFALPSKDGFRVVMATGAGAALIAFVFASFLPRRRPLPAVPATTQAAPAAVASAGGDAGPEGHTEIRGFVRTGDAAPVSRATLTLIDLRGRQVGRAAAREDGSYALTASGAGSYVLIAAAGGHEPQAATVVVGDQPLAYDVTMTGTAELAGTVRSAATREPIAEAMVVVTDARGEVLVAGNTGADGGFTFRDLVAGVCTVAVSAGGRRPCALPVEIAGSGTTRIEVELPAAVQVRGTVRAGAEGTPLADARVTLVDAAGNVAGIATTGTDGEYAFTDLGSGAYTVVASGYPPVTAALALNGNDESGFDITLRHADE
jgi:MFS family permease